MATTSHSRPDTCVSRSGFDDDSGDKSTMERQQQQQQMPLHEEEEEEEEATTDVLFLGTARKHTEAKRGGAAKQTTTNGISFHEREKITEEVHGVAEIPTETPRFIQASIAAFDRALQGIPKRKRRSLDKAFFLRPSLQSDTGFKLLFLRTDYFDAIKAAQRMVQYFDFKRYLFGDDKLVKDLTVADLDEKDINAMFRSGYISAGLVPPSSSVDHRGRPVFFFDSSKYDCAHRLEVLRCCWYMYMVTVQENELASRLGACIVVYHSSAPSATTEEKDILSASSNQQPSYYHRCHVTESVFYGCDMLSSLPMRFASFHFCYHQEPGTMQAGLEEDSAMKLLVSYDKSVHHRIRTHIGSDIDIQKSLMTFGIHCNGLLLSATGGEKHDNRHAITSPTRIIRESRTKINRSNLCDLFLDQRRQIEQQRLNKALCNISRMTTRVIPYPSKNDVLVGRGVPYQEYSGNRRHQELVDSLSEEYQKCKDRVSKTCISMGIVRTIQKSGGRFLTRTKIGWEVIDDGDAKDKTAGAFRSKKSIRNRQQQQQKRSSTLQQESSFESDTLISMENIMETSDKQEPYTKRIRISNDIMEGEIEYYQEMNTTVEL